MKFSQIKHKIKNLGNFKSVKEIKEAGLRIVYNKKDDSYWLIEEEFLKPVIKSPRECKSILIKKEDLKYKVFMCHKSKEELKGTKALDYIKWGEKQGYHKRPTCASRERWWDLGEIKLPILSKRFVDVIFSYFWNKFNFFVGDTFFVIKPEKQMLEKLLILFLNSTVGAFFTEIYGRKLMGEGVLLVYGPEINNILILKEIEVNNLNSSYADLFFQRESKSIFTELGFDPTKPIREQEPNPLPDRKALDDIVFDALGLTEQERKEVYWAVAELVKNRLDKARSVRR